MNMNSYPTTFDLSALLMACNDDACHHIMWVDLEGEVHISPLPEDLSPAGWEESVKAKIKFRYETFDPGNEYVGIKAANDPKYLNDTLAHLKRDWANDARGYIDY